MKTHNLKTWPQYFERVLDGSKTFEVRNNDRDFQTGDILILLEYDPNNNSFTNRTIKKVVSYTLHGGNFGLEHGFVVLGLNNTSNQNER